MTESGNTDVIVEEALRVEPREILLPEDARHHQRLSPILHRLYDKPVTFIKDRAFDYHQGRQRLIKQFQTVSLEGFGCEHLKAGIIAAGAVMFYVAETQKQPVEHIRRIEPYSLNSYLLLDDSTCRNLELIKNIQSGSRRGSLIGILDRTITALGGRLLKQWIRYPLLDPRLICRRQQAIAEAKDKGEVRKQLRDGLKSVRDLERLGGKITMGHANARDLLGLKESLQALPELLSVLSSLKAELFRFQHPLDDLYELASKIEKAVREDAPPTIHEGGLIKQGYHPELDRLIQISREGKGWLARLEQKEREALGIASLKVRYNKIFGYYIEVPKSYSDRIPAHYVRKQTLVNAERYITDELKTYEQEVLGAE
ncbi:MAG: DNA mismatch repair protein MutS, partial [Deltaproteobacteria bacterium]|nr:DNA mismatch repair protein MutS [Deltaproteobacteria bacterium]